MKRMAIALFELAKSVVTRPVKTSKQPLRKLHWIKFEKPIGEMTQLERRAAAERLADEMLGVAKGEDR